MTDEQKKLITFELRADIYKLMHTIVSSVTESCGFVFSEEGLSIITADPTNVAMGSVNIDKNSFVEYEMEEGKTKPLKIGFDMDKLKEMGLLEDYNKENVRFTIFECKDEHNSNETKTMCNVHHDIFNDTITLPPINTVRMPKKMPTIKHTCFFTTDKQTLSKVTGHKIWHNSGISIVCNKNSVHFAHPTSQEWSTDKIKIDETGEAKSMYSSEYMSNFIEVIPDIIPVEFSYKTDSPCEMKIEFAGGCIATWMIAPLLERD